MFGVDGIPVRLDGMDETNRITEENRLAALEACKNMDTPRDPAFDRLVFIAAQLFRTPMALLTLLDRHRSWAKARVGPVPAQRVRGRSVTNVVVQENAPLLSNDITLDRRLEEIPLLLDGRVVRFVASVPLRGPGALPIGALTVCCTEERAHAGLRLSMLEELGREAEDLLCLRIPGMDVSRGKTF